MAISVICKTCEKTLRVRDELAGKQVKCPGCGQVLAIPSGAGSTKALAQGPAEEGNKPAVARPWTGSKKRRRPPAPSFLSRNKWWFVGGGAACLIALVIGLVVSGRDRSRPAEGPQVAQARSEAQPGPAQPAKTAKDSDLEATKPPPAQPKPPDSPPPKGPEKRPVEDVQIQLVRFGPARLEHPQFRGRNLTGVVIEIEGLQEGVLGKFEAASVAALSGAGRAVPAAVLFTAGGCDGLAATAQILAGSVGKAGDVYIGNARFPSEAAALGISARARNASVRIDKGQEFTAGADGALHEASTPGATAGRVHLAPAETSYQFGDFLLCMPLILERGGGVEYGFVPGKKVRLGFLFPGGGEALTSVKLLGYTLELEPGKRAGELVAAKPPDPKGVPMPEPKDKVVVDARPGWYAVKATGGEPRLLVEQEDHYATAVTKDLKSVAVFAMAREKDSPKGKGRPVAAVRIAVAPVGKPLRTIWTAPAPADGQPLGRTLRWSPGGQRLLLSDANGLLVVDTTGKSRVFSSNVVVGGFLGDWHTARWAGRGDTEVAVMAHGLPDELLLLNANTGQRRKVCQLPSGLLTVDDFDLSEDLSTVALITRLNADPTKKTAGVWLWRRGQQGFVHVVTGHVDTAALSPDGKYLAVTTVNLQGNQRTSALHDVVKKTELWSAPISVAGYAFDPADKHLALATHDCKILVTPIAAFDPTELVKGGSSPVEQPIWSADGQEVAFRQLAADKAPGEKPVRPALPPDLKSDAKVTKVLRGRKGLLADGKALTANFRDRDVVVLLKVENVPASVMKGGVNLFLDSHVMAGGEKRTMNNMTVPATGTSIWCGTVVPITARTLTLHVPGLAPIKVDLPKTLPDEVKEGN